MHWNEGDFGGWLAVAYVFSQMQHQQHHAADEQDPESDQIEREDLLTAIEFESESHSKRTEHQESNGCRHEYYSEFGQSAHASPPQKT